MNKFLFFGLWLWLSFEMAGSLTCYKCFREQRNGKCRKAEKPCVAKRGESCFRQRLITEGVTLYVSAGCGLDCKTVSAGRGIRHINICCTQNLCNAKSSHAGVKG